MALPTDPPVDNDPNLSVADVAACIWFVWQRTFQNMTAYPDPGALAAAVIKGSYPAKPWGVPPDVDGPAKKFYKDIQDVLHAYTQFRINLGFAGFTKAFDDNKTWGDLAAEMHKKAIYSAKLRKARVLKGLLKWSGVGKVEAADA